MRHWDELPIQRPMDQQVSPHCASYCDHHTQQCSWTPGVSVPAASAASGGPRHTARCLREIFSTSTSHRCRTPQCQIYYSGPCELFSSPPRRPPRPQQLLDDYVFSLVRAMALVFVDGALPFPADCSPQLPLLCLQLYPAASAAPDAV
uniref:Uncharacterized protein n=1 Tax=Lygus hesperus TaxID=30085 RepID=A0A146L844_LYGHE